MPEPGPEMVRSRDPEQRISGTLNETQQRRLIITCQYIDKLLIDIEHVLHSTASKSPFPRYVIDITPAQARVIEDHIRRLRSQLLRALEWQHMKPEPANVVFNYSRLCGSDVDDVAGKGDFDAVE